MEVEINKSGLCIGRTTKNNNTFVWLSKLFSNFVISLPLFEANISLVVVTANSTSYVKKLAIFNITTNRFENILSPSESGTLVAMFVLRGLFALERIHLQSPIQCPKED